MPSTNLKTNAITFRPAAGKIDMYFSKDDLGQGFKMSKSLLPPQIIRDLNLDEEVSVIYTSFSEYKEGFKSFNVRLDDFRLDFVKNYHNFLISQYFVRLGAVVNKNFIRDVQIWMKSEQIDGDFQIFEKFTVKCQVSLLSDSHELLITYDGESKISQKTVNQLIDLPTASIGKVLQENNIFKYHNEIDNLTIDNDKAFPILNLAIKNDLNIPLPAPDRSNKYLKFISKIETFKETYLNTEGFKRIIQVTNFDFVKLKTTKISAVKSDSNELLFSNGIINKIAAHGIKEGPYSKSPYSKVHFFFIYHNDDVEHALKLNTYYQTGLGFFKGLENYTKIRYYTEKNFSIKFSNLADPMSEIRDAIENKEWKADVEYFAIYLSPFNKHESDKGKRSIYYKVKKYLLHKNIHSQVVVTSKMMAQAGNNFAYSMVNIAIATLAKLGGTPWRIKSSLKNELVVGVGAFRNQESGLQYVGSAFSFQNNGKFNEFDCFVKTNTAILAGAIQDAVLRFTNVNRPPERLIIHFYKDMSQREINPIIDKLHNLGLNIPVFIVTINKTESRDVIAWDTDSPLLMPMSGTFVNVGRNTFLLFNNTKYENSHNAADGFPFPVKLKITCTQADLLVSPTIRELIDQVYQFSRMYWKSVKQQHLPVTIKYPEMVAEIFPHFDSLTIPEFGRDKLWFL